MYYMTITISVAAIHACHITIYRTLKIWLLIISSVACIAAKKNSRDTAMSTYHAQHLGSEIDDHVDMTVHQQEEEPAGNAAPDGQVGQLQNIGQVTIYSTQPYKART